MSFEYLDLSQYTFGAARKLIESEKYSTTYEITDKQSYKLFLAEISKCHIPIDSEDDIRFYREEVSIMIKMNHPSILKTIGFNYKEFNMPTIVTEYSSQSLSELILKHNRGQLHHKWDDTQKLICIYGITSAMDFLHKRGIVHGDLNAQTIFIDDLCQPKIKYSKIFKIIYESYSNYDEFDDLSLIVVENLRYNFNYTKKDDVYAFSLILYLILNGNKLPLVKGNRPIQFNNDVVKAFQELFMKCNSKNPDERPTFEEIKNSLKSDKKFFSEKVDSKTFYEYVKSIDSEIAESESIDNNNETAGSELINSNNEVVESEPINNDDDDDDDDEIEKEFICPVCKKQFTNENDIFWYNGVQYHKECVNCQICHKNLISIKNKEDEADEDEIDLKDFVFVATGFFFCRDDFNKYRYQRNPLPEKIQDEYLRRMTKDAIDGLFNSFIDYNKGRDILINNQIEILTINKNIKLFVPSITFHFSNSIDHINFEELIKVIPKEMIIINIEKGSTFLTIAFILSDEIPETELKYLEVIQPLKNHLASAIGEPIVGNIISEPIIETPENEKIKEFFQKESINILQLDNILEKINFKEIIKEVKSKLKESKDCQSKYEFIFKHMELFNEAEDAIRKDIENNEIELVVTGITIIANSNYDRYNEAKEFLSQDGVELFLYHGTHLQNIKEIAKDRFLTPDEIKNDIVQTDKGYFGRGIYATDNIFYASMYTTKTKEHFLKYLEKGTLLCCKAIYNKEFCIILNDHKYTKFYNKGTNFTYLDMNAEIIRNGGIHKISVDSTTRFLPIDINTYSKQKIKVSPNKFKYVSANEFVFPNSEQIFPVCSVTVLRPNYYVLWLYEQKDKQNNKYFDDLRTKLDVNFYRTHSIDETVQFVDLKKRNKVKFIITVDDIDLCRSYIDRVRQIHQSNFVCLIFSNNESLKQLSTEMENVLFADEFEFLHNFIKNGLDNMPSFYEVLQKKYEKKFNINEDCLIKFYPISKYEF